ncbi:MAG: futalosine hydrolase [Bacteroidota bacterium]
MRLLIVAATPYEILPLQKYLETNFQQKEEGIFEREELQIQVLVTGVGQMLTAFALGSILSTQSFDLLLNAGVAGAFDRSLKLGAVVNVVSERLGDLGAEDHDGSFIDVHELGLIEGNTSPFENGISPNPTVMQFDFLPNVKALTINKVHGSHQSVAAIQKKYPDVQVESMEGAAFFYAALMADIPFLQIRAISNYVEARNREAWELGLAIEKLNQVLVEMIKGFGG